LNHRPPPGRSRRLFLASASGALLAGCSATGALNSLVPADTYRLQTDIAYGDESRQRLDVYRPLTTGAATPLVVFFYGGSWTRGERADYRFVGEALASAGIVTVVADYRLSPQVPWTTILADCALATAWAFRQAAELGASPRRVHLMGHSAGAYNAAMLALDPRWLARVRHQPGELAGWVGLAGPYDFLPISDPDTRRAFGAPETPADSQPVVHVSAGAPRCLLLAPREDRTVDPVRNTLGLAERLRGAGAPVRSQLLEGVNHVTIVAALAPPLRRLAPVRDEVVRFLLA
jgi:acetyl esterase/lipase